MSASLLDTILNLGIFIFIGFLVYLYFRKEKE